MLGNKNTLVAQLTNYLFWWLRRCVGGRIGCCIAIYSLGVVQLGWMFLFNLLLFRHLLGVRHGVIMTLLYE